MRYKYLFLFLLISVAANAKKHKRFKKHQAAAHTQRSKSEPSNQVRLVFTFDDGPAPQAELTPSVLQTLQRHNIHAVFFVNGINIADPKKNYRARELLEQTAQAGHVIGNHTVSHYDLCSANHGPKSRYEIQESARLIEEVVGYAPPLLRIPFGRLKTSSKAPFCEPLHSVMKELQVSHTGWDVDAQEWRKENSKPEVTLGLIEAALISFRRAPSHEIKIVLLHDTRPVTAAALPKLLDWIAEENRRCLRDKCPQFVIEDPLVLVTEDPKKSEADWGEIFIKVLFYRLQDFLNPKSN